MKGFDAMLSDVRDWYFGRIWQGDGICEQSGETDRIRIMAIVIKKYLVKN